MDTGYRVLGTQTRTLYLEYLGHKPETLILDTSVWCPRDAKVGVRIGTNSDTKFGALGTLTVFTVHRPPICCPMIPLCL